MNVYPLLAGAALLPIYLLCLFVWRLYFHPLSKYPGPTLAAITNWHMAFYAYRGDLHIYTRHLHEKYGTIVRAGPNTLWFNTSTGMQGIYGTQANVRKSDPWIALSASRHNANILNVIDKSTSAFKRRTLVPVFGSKGVNKFEKQAVNHIQSFIRLLAPGTSVGTWGPPMNVAELSNWLAFDIISGISYGQSFRMLDTSDMRWLPSVYTWMSRRSMTSLVQPKVFRWKIDRLFLAAWYRRILEGGTWVFNRAEARVAAQDEAEGDDMFSAMMDARDPKTGLKFTLKDMWVESMLLLAAGADTTAATISAAFFYLLHYPAALACLTAEIRATFASEDEIRMGPKLKACRFLQACIDETMRLCPAVPNPSPRYVEAGGMTINGEYIPEGTTVGTSIYALHRSEAYFSNPGEFIPERWIPHSDTRDSGDYEKARSAFFPFSTGPRSCIGAKLAGMEVSIVLARTLYLYDVRWAPGRRCCDNTLGRARCDDQIRSWALFAPDIIMVQFSPRQP